MESPFSVLYHNVPTFWAGHQGRKDVSGASDLPLGPSNLPGQKQSSVGLQRHNREKSEHVW